MARDPACLFCRIVAGTTPAEFLYRDEHTAVLRDVRPQAPFHALVVPVEHVRTLDDLREEHAALVAELVLRAVTLAREHGLAEGYRLVWNCGTDAGQSVWHIHLHVLGGRALAWPPG